MTTLSVTLRSETHAAHREAERSSFVSYLLKGSIGFAGYLTYIDALREVYGVLEDAIAIHRADPRLSWFDWTAVFRHDVITRDVEAIQSRRRVEAVARGLPSVLAYTRSINGEGRASVPALLGHAYTRYLGDLSGGVMIGRALQTRLGLSSAELSFYRFARPTELLKQEFRAGLDGLEMSKSETEDVVTAANDGFRWSRQLFEDLGRCLSC